MRVTRQVLRNGIALQNYMQGLVPNEREVMRQAFVLERERDFRMPDHYFTNERERVFGTKPSGVADILLTALDAFSKTFLETFDGRVFVQKNAFAAWQEELSRLSPLPIIAYHLYRKHGAPAKNPHAIRNYIVGANLENYRHTVLLGVHNPVLGDILDRQGLTDLHLHLNGTTEVDKVWLNALENLDCFRNQFFEGVHKDIEEVHELLAQIEPGLDHRGFINRMRVARRLRLAMLAQVLDGESSPRLTMLLGDEPMSRYAREAVTNLNCHPLTEVMFAGGIRHSISGSSLIDEILTLVILFDQLEATKNDDLANALYAYLLCWNAMFVPMCVQSAEQVGFDQFQKFTQNEVREYAEKKYKDRFHQVSNNIRSDLVFLEGRIAPKTAPDKLIRLLSGILRGYKAYHSDCYEDAKEQEHSYPLLSLYTDKAIKEVSRMRLGLVVHFIKYNEMANKDRVTFCRHYMQRQVSFNQWRVFRKVRDQSKLVRRYFCGVDAAANELHAPPETFAPLFRACRRDGVKNFTYHVGEDFQNLISGIRAVEEAVKFLDLRAGNRLGHATAIGIEPELWLKVMPETITVRVGDWFDDLVYARYVLQGEVDCLHLLGKIDYEIGRYSEILLGDASISHSTLYRAWELRKLDPLQFVNVLENPPKSLDDGQREEWQLLRTAKMQTPQAYEVFSRYHEEKFVEKARRLISISSNFFPRHALRILQQNVQRLVNKKDIVLEALPTSNVRISFYKSYDEHHIHRWLFPGEGDEKMRVVVSTDDPGIFSTNMRNEFEHILREFEAREGCNKLTAEAQVRELNDNGHKFKFRPS